MASSRARALALAALVLGAPAAGAATADLTANALAAIKAELAAEYEAKLDAMAQRYDAQLERLAVQLEQQASSVGAHPRARRAERNTTTRRRRRQLKEDEEDVAPARRLATVQMDSENYNGLAIMRDNAGISMGKASDVLLARTGGGELGVAANVSIGGTLNVTDGLEVAGRDVLDAIDESYCPPHTEACDAATVGWDVVSKCCFGGGWREVYELEITSNPNYDAYEDIPYTVDNSDSIAIGSFRRIAYHWQLDDEWLFVAVDAFTDNATLTGLPIDEITNGVAITGITVASNAPNLTAFNGMTNGVGTMEFWSNCYARGVDGVYNHDDVISETESCYGAMQVHADDGSTIFAYNAWSSGTRMGDLGFGNGPGEHPDWTFTDSVENYDAATMTVLVNEAPAPFVASWYENKQYLDDVRSCSFTTDAAARCAEPSDFKMANCCDGGGWDLVYELQVEDSANYNAYSDIPYTVDNSADFEGVAFDRIAYHVELDDEWVWVSMKAFTPNATKIGLPIDWDRESEFARDMTVLSNAVALQNLTGMTQAVGDVQFWSNCTSSSTGVHRSNCFGSFQVHISDGTCVFAYNAWGSSSEPGDLGFGPGTGDHPDWTLAANVKDYDVKTIRAYVSRGTGLWTPFIEDVATIPALTEQLAETTAALDDLLSCSYANDINARCGNASNAFKMGYCCDGGGWKMVYQLNILDEADYDQESDVTYAVDNSADYDDDSFSRVGYHLQLDDEWVFVSMNAWTGDPTALQLPVDMVVDYSEVGRLNIVSNAAALVNLTGTSHLTGDIEFWSNCYSSSGNTHGSDSTASTSTDCYGSFQVHTENGDTVFAYNAWSNVNNNDLGIGNNPNSVHSDWTFEDNAADYDVKVLSVFVLPK